MVSLFIYDPIILQSFNEEIEHKPHIIPYKWPAPQVNPSGFMHAAWLT